jgi:hypothetical protein
VAGTGNARSKGRLWQAPSSLRAREAMRLLEEGLDLGGLTYRSRGELHLRGRES